MRLEGIGFGFLIPIYFVVTGMTSTSTASSPRRASASRRCSSACCSSSAGARRCSGCASSAAAQTRSARPLRRDRAAADRRDRRHRHRPRRDRRGCRRVADRRGDDLGARPPVAGDFDRGRASSDHADAARRRLPRSEAGGGNVTSCPDSTAARPDPRRRLRRDSAPRASSKDADVDVVLVDKHDYHTFQPLLYQVATDLLETAAVGHPLRDLFHDQPNVTVHQATVDRDRPRQREVQFEEMAPLAYDYLVLGARRRGQLLRRRGRGGARLPDVHARRRGAPARSTSWSTGRPPTRIPSLDRRRRAQRRHRRRRPDRRRERRRHRRALPQQLREGLPGPPAGEGADHAGRGRPGALHDVQAEPPRATRRRRCEKRGVEVAGRRGRQLDRRRRASR